MALSLESPNLVRQKAYNAAHSANPLVYNVLKAWFRNWVIEGGNANLQFIPFGEGDLDTGGGVVLADAACQVYLVYVRKGSTATVNYVKLYDDATNDGTTTDQRLVIELDSAGQEVIYAHEARDGAAYATGVVVTAHTTSEGTTDGTDSGDGFVIIGAA